MWWPTRERARANSARTTQANVWQAGSTENPTKPGRINQRKVVFNLRVSGAAVCIGSKFLYCIIFSALVIIMSRISHAQVSTCSLHRHWLHLRALLLPFAFRWSEIWVAWRKTVWLACTLVLDRLQSIHVLLLRLPANGKPMLYCSSGICISSHRLIIPPPIIPSPT